MKTKHGLLFGFAVIAIAAIFTLTGCPTEDDGGGGSDDKTVDGFVFTAKETRSSDTLYLLSDTYDAALASLNAKFGASASTILGNSNLATDLAKNAPEGAALYIVSKSSGKTIRYLAKKESGSWDSSSVSWVDNGGNGEGPGPGGDELWEKFTAGSGKWTKDDITLTFTYDETVTSRGYANLRYTTTWYLDGNHDLYVKLNSASSWYGSSDGSKNIAFNSDDAAGTVTFTSPTSMTISGISTSESESRYNGTYTRQGD